jgi:hypothetical protein
MKTFKDFLSDSIDGPSVDGIVEMLKRDCSPFLKVAKVHNYPLLRGMDETSIVSTIPQPKYRKPKDSTAAFNKMFNFIVEGAIGVKDIRAQTLFCTTNFQQANIYGNVHYIFPKGDYKFIWSPEIYDSYSSDTLFLRAFSDSLVKELGIFQSISFKMARRLWTRIAENENYLTDNEKLAELFEICEIQFKEGADLVHAMASTAKPAFENLQYQTSGLRLAFKSMNEILFYESGGYYAIYPEKLAAELHMQDLNFTKLEDIDKLYDEFLRRL